MSYPRWTARAVAPCLVFTWLGCGAAAPAPKKPEPPPDPPLPSLPWTRVPAAASHKVAAPDVALVGGAVMTAAGQTFAPGTVVLSGGQIAAVGPADQVAVPNGAKVVDVARRTVTPGLIDTHSHMGVYASPGVRATADGNEATSPVTAEVWAGDSFWPQDPALPRAVAGGVTTIQVLPGSANLVGGRGVIVKLHLGRTVSEMLFRGAPDTLKMACGENPKRVYGDRKSAPSTRMGSVAATRAAFQKAVEYGEKWEAWRHKKRTWQIKEALHERATKRGVARREKAPGPAPEPPGRDFGLEALLGVVEGRVLAQMHCYRADEMARIMEIAEGFGFQIRSFHHAVEAYKIRDLLAERGVGVSTWVDWWGFKLEAYDAIPENMALLAEAGVHTALHSDSAMLVQRLNQEAGKALAYGRHAGIALDREQALRFITAEPAWVLGIDAFVGTLEVGKMADVVVWSGDPFSVYTQADLVFIDGVRVFDRNQGHGAAMTDFEVGQEMGP